VIFPEKITAPPLLRKELVPARVRHAPKSTRQFRKMTIQSVDAPGFRRVEMKLSPEGMKRLQALKKTLGFSKNSEVMEALLFEASVDHKIDPDVSDRLEQKIDYLIERIEMMT
jgi:hypothetical protein